MVETVDSGGVIGEEEAVSFLELISCYMCSILLSSLNDSGEVFEVEFDAVKSRCPRFWVEVGPCCLLQAFYGQIIGNLVLGYRRC